MRSRVSTNCSDSIVLRLVIPLSLFMSRSRTPSALLAKVITPQDSYMSQSVQSACAAVASPFNVIIGPVGSAVAGTRCLHVRLAASAGDAARDVPSEEVRRRIEERRGCYLQRHLTPQQVAPKVVVERSKHVAGLDDSCTNRIQILLQQLHLC